MKTSKFKASSIAIASLLFCSVSFITSCEDNDQTADIAEKNNTKQLDEFEYALKSLNSAANIESNKMGKSEADQAFQGSLIEASRQLIYSTGITEEQLNAKYGSNNTAIISLALKIHTEKTQGILNAKNK